MNNDFDFEGRENPEPQETPEVSAAENTAVPQEESGSRTEMPPQQPVYPQHPYNQPYGGQNYYGQQGYTQPISDGSYRYTGSTIPGNQYQDPRYGYNYGENNGTYGYQPPVYQQPVQESTKKAKKKSGNKRVVAIAIVCALLGGVGGGAAVGMAIKNSGDHQVEEAAPPVETEAPVSATESVAEPIPSQEAFHSTVIDVTTNSSATDMTPQDVYENYVNAVVAISNESTTNVFGQLSTTASSGSGFIISEDGYIVTNNHVIKDAETLTVIMTSGEEYEAQVIGADEDNDVALIKIEAADLPTVSIGDSAGIEVGEMVCAIGNPLGELTNTLTVGYISALDREINDNGSPINMFQTDCAINSGNSGGPLFDMNGNVIGITTAKYSSNGYSASIEGIGFCIPINDAMDIVSDLLQYGYVKGRAYLGITCQAISPTVTQYYNLPAGIYVNSVEVGSCAETAGLKQGDIICSVDGVEVSSVTDFKGLLKEYTAGDSAMLSVYRGETGQMMETEITFDEKPGNVEPTVTQVPQTPLVPDDGFS